MKLKNKVSLIIMKKKKRLDSEIDILYVTSPPTYLFHFQIHPEQFKKTTEEKSSLEVKDSYQLQYGDAATHLLKSFIIITIIDLLSLTFSKLTFFVSFMTCPIHLSLF